ncbi:VOC family protein [Geodermatophilus sp. SYSU D01062]
MTQQRQRVTELRLVVTATDHEAAVRFFRDVLGLPQQEAHEARGGHVVVLDAGRATLEINDPAYAEYIDEVEVGHRVPGRIRVAFEVPDTRAATADLVDAGADLVAEPTVTPWDTLNSRLHGPERLLLTVFGPVEEQP